MVGCSFSALTLCTFLADDIPPDGSPIDTITVFSTFTVVLIFTLSIFGMLLSLVCLAFTIIFRERK